MAEPDRILVIGAPREQLRERDDPHRERKHRERET
jgi:hypothetical protein